ncbi:hypothetical protein TUM15771_04450 [Neisseria gonorrhoeae]|nr:hypothetical protein TUM15771_04450 [Neisseria gonorrhoeae]
MRLPAPRRFDGIGDGIGLNRFKHKTETENQAQGEQHAQPFLPQTVRDVVGRAAPEMVVVAVADFKELRQRRFDKRRTHAD